MEIKHAFDVHYKIFHKRICIGKTFINSLQPAIVPNGDWLIDGIVGE